MASNDQLYPRVIRRIQGGAIDGVVISVAAIGAIVLMTVLGIESGSAKAISALAVIFTLEPLAVSVTGGSIGHHVVGLRVRRVSSDRRINILSAVIRFVVKTIAGLPSFLMLVTTQRRQALHDLLSGSVVVYKDGRTVPMYDVLPELNRAAENDAYQSVWRRILVIFIYWIVTAVVLGSIAESICGFEECSENAENAYVLLRATTWMALIAFAYFGWNGYLYGTRKSRSP